MLKFQLYQLMALLLVTYGIAVSSVMHIIEIVLHTCRLDVCFNHYPFRKQSYTLHYSTCPVIAFMNFNTS